MIALNEDQLRADLELCEGRRRHVYKCSEGKNTIGIGRNLDDIGLTPDERTYLGHVAADYIHDGAELTDEQINYLLHNDMKRVQIEFDHVVPWWREMPEPAQRALANMSFNIGWPRLSGFHHMLAALKDGQFQFAADEALDSKWAKQVGDGVVGNHHGREDMVGDLFRGCTKA